MFSSIYLKNKWIKFFYKAKNIYNQHYYYQYKELDFLNLIQAFIYKLNKNKDNI